MRAFVIRRRNGDEYQVLVDDEDYERVIAAGPWYVKLPEATCAQNMRNSRMRSDNSSGLKGVSFCKERGRWQAKISLHGKTVNLGRYDTREQAHAAYRDAAERCYGEFARTG